MSDRSSGKRFLKPSDQMRSINQPAPKFRELKRNSSVPSRHHALEPVNFNCKIIESAGLPGMVKKIKAVVTLDNKLLSVSKGSEPNPRKLFWSDLGFEKTGESEFSITRDREEPLRLVFDNPNSRVSFENHARRFGGLRSQWFTTVSRPSEVKEVPRWRAISGRVPVSTLSVGVARDSKSPRKQSDKVAESATLETMNGTVHSSQDAASGPTARDAPASVGKEHVDLSKAEAQLPSKGSPHRRKQPLEGDSVTGADASRGDRDTGESPARSRSKRPKILVDYSRELLSDEDGLDPADEPNEAALKTLEERGLVQAAYRSPFEKRTIKLDRYDIGRLLPGYYLNDSLINFFTRYFMDDLQQRNPSLASKVHVFSTYFYSQSARPDGLNRMTAWLNKIPLDKEVYLMPIHSANHWTLAAIVGAAAISTGKTAALVLLDSLGSAHTQSRAIKRVVKGSFAKLFETKNPKSVLNPRMACLIANTPIQSNSIDCGVFMLNYIVDILNDPDRFVKEVEKESKTLAIDWKSFASSQKYGDRVCLLDIVEQFAVEEEVIESTPSNEGEDSLEIEEIRVSKAK